MARAGRRRHSPLARDISPENFPHFISFPRRIVAAAPPFRALTALSLASTCAGRRRSSAGSRRAAARASWSRCGGRLRSCWSSGRRWRTWCRARRAGVRSCSIPCSITCDLARISSEVRSKFEREGSEDGLTSPASVAATSGLGSGSATLRGSTLGVRISVRTSSNNETPVRIISPAPAAMPARRWPRLR